MVADKSLRKWSLMLADVLEETVDTFEGSSRGLLGIVAAADDGEVKEERRGDRERRKQTRERVTRDLMSHACFVCMIV